MTVNVLSKALAGVQDILFGQGSQAQTRKGSSVNVNRIELTKPLATLADLKALDMSDENNYYPYAETYGLSAVGDGDSRSWWFDSTEAQTSDNNQTIIKGAGVTVGCWKLAKPAVFRGITTSSSNETVTFGPYSWTVVNSGTGSYTLTHSLGVVPIVTVQTRVDASARLARLLTVSTTIFNYIVVDNTTDVINGGKVTIEITLLPEA